jgi:hypothetical protein
MTSLFENQKNEDFSYSDFQQKLTLQYRKLLKQFKKTTRFSVKFNLIFFLLTIPQIFIFSFLIANKEFTYLVLSIGFLFFTCSTYFVLLFYFQAKKPEQLQFIRDKFIYELKKNNPLIQKETQYHLSITDSLMKLVSYLNKFERNLYKTHKIFYPIFNLIEKFSILCHWKDVLRMKELLLYSAIEEHIQLIRLSPTDLDVHTSLANCYVFLSKIYLEPQTLPQTFLIKRQIRKFNTYFMEKFKMASQRAIEEFKILNKYAPDDPWIHLQLAKSYNDLKMPKQEVLEYETILKLKPNDKDILFRLGILYFEQGLNSKGLKVYEKLKEANYQKAEDLIRFFGCFNDQLLFEDIL